MVRFTRSVIMGTTFDTTERYSQLEGIGIGISGLVCSATDHMMHQTVSLKKLAQPFRCSDVARQLFREVKILEYLWHENVCRLGVITNSETNQ